MGAFGAFTTAGFGGDGATTASVDNAQMSDKIYAHELKTSNQEKRSGEHWEGSHQLNSQKVARLCNLYHHHRHISRKTYTLLDIGHRTTKARKTNQSRALPIHRVFATLTISSLYLVEGLPTLHVPIRGRHTSSRPHRPSVLQMCLAYCHLSQQIL